MKGLNEYIKKYGKHFTEELARDVTKRQWNSCKIVRDAQKKVYYNVTGSTVGDMVYLMDMSCYLLSEQYTYNRGIKMMLYWVGNYNKTGSPFLIWLNSLSSNNEDFDFTPYI
jgi:hypothetical protein